VVTLWSGISESSCLVQRRDFCISKKTHSECPFMFSLSSFNQGWIKNRKSDFFTFNPLRLATLKGRLLAYLGSALRLLHWHADGPPCYWFQVAVSLGLMYCTGRVRNTVQVQEIRGMQTQTQLCPPGGAHPHRVYSNICCRWSMFFSHWQLSWIDRRRAERSSRVCVREMTSSVTCLPTCRNSQSYSVSSKRK